MVLTWSAAGRNSAPLASQSLEIDHSSSVTRGYAKLGVCQFCTALTCLGVRCARSRFGGAELFSSVDSRPRSSEPMGSTPAIWAGSQGVSRRPPSYGEHTVAAAAKNCIAMAPTSWRSIEGGSSARPAAYDFLGVLISTVCTLNSFLKFRAILGKKALYLS